MTIDEKIAALAAARPAYEAERAAAAAAAAALEDLQRQGKAPLVRGAKTTP